MCEVTNQRNCSKKAVQNILIDIVAEMLAARLEGCFIKSHKFNQLGGLRLEREIRMLVAHFSNHDHCSAREVFSRLIQIATILNLETVHEIVEFWVSLYSFHLNVHSFASYENMPP